MCCFQLAVVLISAVSVHTKFEFNSSAEVLSTSSGLVRGVRSRAGRDFVLGGLFAIHNAASGGGQCGKIRLGGGLERMEAMLYAVDLINADENLLPGLSLGYDIRDTCSSENIGLDESIDLVITNSQLDIESCRTSANATREEAPTSGVVGASNSGVSVPVAGLLRLFTTPQISYASSSALLNNRDRYGYFYRTTPPDTLQARAMIDLLLHFKWTYISTIFSENTYGEPGIDEVHALAKTYGICIDFNEGIDSSFTDSQFLELAMKVLKSEARVIVLFSSEQDATKLFEHLLPIYSRAFVWIASDSWARSQFIMKKYSQIITPMIGFSPQAKFSPGFLDYFSKLTLDSNVRDPWFQEWYMARLHCTVNGSDSECYRNASVPQLATDYVQGQKSPLVIDAVYAFAHAINNFLTDNCEQPLRWFKQNRTCWGQKRSLNGAALLEYVQRISFTSPTGNRVMFDSLGNAPGNYDIRITSKTPQQLNTDTIIDLAMGTWNSNSLNKAQSLRILSTPQFGINSITGEPLTNPPESQCNKCPPGHFQRQVLSSCCGICDPCLGKLFSRSSSAVNCSTCDLNYWGNNPLNGSNGCIPIPKSFLSFEHPYSLVILIIASVGFLAVCFVLVVFLAHWQTPVVKSFGREQIIILLFGITFSYASAFFHVSPPLPIVCGFQRWTFWTSFSVMFGALLVKVIRVAQIFSKKSSITRPKFIEPHYPVIFTCVIVAIQWLILVISIFVNQPAVLEELRMDATTPNTLPTLVVTCLTENIGFLVVSLAYQSLLVCLCTIIGAMSFKYPANFNEAKCIALCSMTIMVIWIAFIITFFATGSAKELQNIAISLAVVMSGYAVLLSMFGPKMYIILVRPAQNTSSRSHHMSMEPDRNNIDIGNRSKDMHEAYHKHNGEYLPTCTNCY